MTEHSGPEEVSEGPLADAAVAPQGADGPTHGGVDAFDSGEVTSVTDLLTALRESYESKDMVWYRGHEDQSWSLTPSLARPPADAEAEVTLIKRFKQNLAKLAVAIEHDLARPTVSVPTIEEAATLATAS